MVTRLTVISAAGIGLVSLWVFVQPVVAQDQSVRETVEQRMGEQQDTIESTTAATEETTLVQEMSTDELVELASAPLIEIVEEEPLEALPAAETGSMVEVVVEFEKSDVMEEAEETVTAEVVEEMVVIDEAVPSTYTVQPGDTLWTISTDHLSNPFFWPRLWEVNPEVENPDLIFPGSILALPTEEEAEPVPAMAEAEVVVEEGVEEEEFVELEPITLEEELELVEEPALELEPEMELLLVIVEEEPKPAFSFEVLEPPPTRSKEILALSSGYILKKSPPVMGNIVGTYDYRKLMGEGDQVHVLPSRGAAFELQGRYTIYRVVKRVRHPVTGRDVGDLVKILGEVEIHDIHADVATGRVVEFYGHIEPGDSVMLASVIEAAPMEPVVEHAGEPLDGIILDVVDDRLLNGQLDVVFIDQGEDSGVLAGDQFRIYRQAGPAPAHAKYANVRLPDRHVGMLEVLSVQPETATAFLTQSMDSIMPGDRIER